MRSTRKDRLQAYLELYSAVCELSSSLFDRAMESCDDERHAAALASCSLVSALASQRTRRGALLSRMGSVRWRRGRREQSARAG